MELVKTIMIYGYGLTNIFLYCYLMINLIHKRNTYPFSKTCPYLTLFIIFILFLHQILNFLLSWRVYLDDIVSEKLIKIINGINAHFLIMIPVYYKFKLLIKSSRVNYYFLHFGSMNENYLIQ